MNNKKFGLITNVDFQIFQKLILRRNKVKNRQFSSPFSPLKLFFGKNLWKLMENLILSLIRYLIIFLKFIIEVPQLIFEKGIHEKVGKNWAWILWRCKMVTHPLFLAYLQWASSLFLKLFTLSVDTTVSGSEFHDITSTVYIYLRNFSWIPCKKYVYYLQTKGIFKLYHHWTVLH